ncbi:hypothetical protein FA95DRAFT_71504 [Auriscalpium vulgare]|uniref:Uncharacterized protein n=1 Tax=Auriscalpium vulgare TaxID=40419 RepID=A0ACB8S7F8_9AGAM|nr:hypothetical protein FA95DRAFT_71504 [Auriscalpium vulgare]
MVTQPPRPKRNTKGGGRTGKLSRSDRALIRLRKGKGCTQKSLATFFGVSTSAIQYTLKNMQDDDTRDDVSYASGRLPDHLPLKQESPSEGDTDDIDLSEGHCVNIESRHDGAPEQTTPSTSTVTPPHPSVFQPSVIAHAAAKRKGTKVIQDQGNRDTAPTSNSETRLDSASPPRFSDNKLNSAVPGDSAVVPGNSSPLGVVISGLKNGAEDVRTPRTESSRLRSGTATILNIRRQISCKSRALALPYARPAGAKQDDKLQIANLSQSTLSRFQPVAGEFPAPDGQLLAFSARSGPSRLQHVEEIWTFTRSLGLDENQYTIMLSEGIKSVADLDRLAEMNETYLDFVGGALMAKGFSMFEYMKLKNAIQLRKK